MTANDQKQQGAPEQTVPRHDRSEDQRRASNRHEPKDAIIRQWVMLQLIPREPGGITVQQLREKLSQIDPLYDVHKRTIERNLMQMMSIFPSLDYREQAGGNLWFWEKDTVIDIPKLDAKTALMFRLAKDYLSPVLPKATLKELEPHFKQAEITLKDLGDRHYSRWPEKIRIIQNSIQLRHPEIEANTLDAAYEALFHDRKMLTHYRQRSGEVCDYQISLLGLVFRDGLIYGVCKIDGKDNVRQLPLHRMLQATVVEESAEPPPGFDLDRYVRTYFDYPLRELKVNEACRDEIPEKITLTLALDPVSAVHLRESPLAEDQTARDLPDGRVAFRATVNNTERLRWWILSYGAYMEVIGPKDLRQEIVDIIAAALFKYANIDA